jgi:hypothetical protein
MSLTDAHVMNTEINANIYLTDRSLNTRSGNEKKIFSEIMNIYFGILRQEFRCSSLQIGFIIARNLAYAYLQDFSLEISREALILGTQQIIIALSRY